MEPLVETDNGASREAVCQMLGLQFSTVNFLVLFKIANVLAISIQAIKLISKFIFFIENLLFQCFNYFVYEFTYFTFSILKQQRNVDLEI